MDLTPFSWINPCGYPGLATIDMKTLGVDIAVAEAQLALTSILTKHLA
jgi:lipoyl(octanoyl) transferase